MLKSRRPRCRQWEMTSAYERRWEQWLLPRVCLWLQMTTQGQMCLRIPMYLSCKVLPSIIRISNQAGLIRRSCRVQWLRAKQLTQLISTRSASLGATLVQLICLRILSGRTRVAHKARLRMEVQRKPRSWVEEIKSRGLPQDKPQRPWPGIRLLSPCPTATTQKKTFRAFWPWVGRRTTGQTRRSWCAKN